LSERLANALTLLVKLTWHLAHNSASICVFHAQGKTFPNWLFSRVAKSMVDIDPHAKLSMWWDLEQGRATEIDFINGATIKAGKDLGIPTPMNEIVYNAIKKLEQSPTRYSLTAQELR